MINAKYELLKLVKETEIVAASIHHEKNYKEYEEEFFNIELRKNHTQEELDNFLNSLNFEYDNGYGCQHLFGYVWLENNQWLERVEYDGSEYWINTTVPEIPEHLR